MFHTHEECCDYAKSKGGQCLEKVYKNTELGEEIIILKDYKNMTFEAISEDLSVKHPDDPRVFDVAWVKDVYYSTKNTLGGLSALNHKK